MKFKFSLKNKEASFDADIEKLIEKKMDRDHNRPPKPVKKTRYQIRHEEKRKMEELKHKQDMQFIKYAGIAIAAGILFCLIMSFFE